MSGGLEFLNENSQIIVNLGAAATAIGTAIGVYFKFVRPKWRRILGTWDSIDRIEKQQGTIAQELTFNGGLTTKDIIGRMENKIESVAAEVSLVRGIQRAIVSNLETPYFETDDKGRCIWVNRFYLDLTGKQLGDVLINGWGTVIAPEDRGAVLREWADCIVQDRDFDMRYRVIDAEQQRVPVRSMARRIKNSAGQTIAWAGSWTEVGRVAAHAA